MTCETCAGDGYILFQAGNGTIDQPCPDCQPQIPLEEIDRLAGNFRVSPTQYRVALAIHRAWFRHLGREPEPMICMADRGRALMMANAAIDTLDALRTSPDAGEAEATALKERSVSAPETSPGVGLNLPAPYTVKLRKFTSAGHSADIFNGSTRVAHIPPSTSYTSEQVIAKAERFARVPVLEAALHLIATGKGIYGAQALEYKNLARLALGMDTL